MPAFLLGIYYTLESGFAFTAGWLNIALYVLSLALGFWLMARLTKTGGLSWLCGVLVIAAGLYGAALILFTMAPPALADFPGLSEKSLHFPQIYVDIRPLCQYNSWRKQRRSGKHRNSPPALRRG